MTQPQPLVSIICATYNHEKFIAQALEGFVMQKTSFPFEVIVHDDASTDDTALIIKEYEARFPGLFANIYQSENQFSKAIGSITKLTFAAARGKYIAFCEGDDYWIDPYKLQKQVDFLENNPGYVICSHRVFELENGKKRLSDLKKSTNGETYTIEELAKGNLMYAPSVVFRNGLIKDFPIWFSQTPVGDYVLHMLNARYGKIKYLPDIMAVYRMHAGGVWSQQEVSLTRKKWIKVLDYLLTENFSDEVKNNLKKQKKENIVANLKDLYRKDESAFKVELQQFTDNDPEFSRDWLFIHYPALIKENCDTILNSREFKVGHRLIGPLKRIKNIFRTIFF